MNEPKLNEDFEVDELTPEQELENFKAWEKSLWERTRKKLEEYNLKNDVDFDVAVDKNEEKIIKDSAEEWANQVVGRWHEMQKEKNNEKD